MCVSERGTQIRAEVNELLRGSVPRLSLRMVVSPPAAAPACSSDQFLWGVLIEGGGAWRSVEMEPEVTKTR